MTIRRDLPRLSLAEKLGDALRRDVSPAFVARVEQALRRYSTSNPLHARTGQRGAPSTRLVLRWDVFHAIKEHFEFYEPTTGNLTDDAVSVWAGRRGPAARVLAVVLGEADHLDGSPRYTRREFKRTQWERWLMEFSGDDEE